MIAAIVIVGFWPTKAALLKNLGKLSDCGDKYWNLLQRIVFKRHQQHSELNSNDIVLIKEHNHCAIVVSDVPPLGT